MLIECLKAHNFVGFRIRVKHLNELFAFIETGYDAYIVFIVQMKGVKRVEPNRVTHPTFVETLKFAQQAGEKLLGWTAMLRRIASLHRTWRMCWCSYNKSGEVEHL